MVKHEEQDNLLYYQLTHDVSLVHQLVHALYQLNIQSVLVEGGLQLLQSFIDEGYWDEIRKIENKELKIENGLPAPVFENGNRVEKFEMSGDEVEIFYPASSSQ
jgi:diaminohydroxyphosphoribosylaminopyrimidine deaminase/5-amino-6-(5-phosphoribosylamino)uracil reductase